MAAERYFILDLVIEVLLRVPAAQVNRLREVSPLWRFTIESRFFRQAHRRRRSPMLLVFSRRDTSASHLDLSRVDLLEFDADEREPRRLISFHPVPTPPPLRARFPELQALGATPDSLFRVEGSFGGVLLVSYDGELYACNPCTRRWQRLPPIHLHRAIVGVYGANAAPTPALTVLFADGIGGYSLLKLASGIITIRDIGMPTLADSPPQLSVILRDGLRQDWYDDPPIYIDGYLYWRPQLEEHAFRGITAFNTNAEEFGWLDPPSLKVGSVGSLSRTVEVQMLFQTGGSLAAATIDLRSMSVQVWIRQSPMWLPIHRLLLPSQAITAHIHTVHGMLNRLRVFVASDRFDMLIQLPRAALHADRRGRVVGYHADIVITPHLFLSNFDPDDFLPVPGTGHKEDECADRPFFDFAGSAKP
jgi:hypothetical protein